ncbi:MAG: hypothetical protein ACP5IL_01005 [Syntrophobacteraceae bacterium]
MKRKEPTNDERRETERAAKEAEAGRYKIARLWQEYKNQKRSYRTLKTDLSNFKYLATIADKEPHEIVKLDVDRLRIRLSKSKSLQTVKQFWFF